MLMPLLFCIGSLLSSIHTSGMQVQKAYHKCGPCWQRAKVSCLKA